MRPRLGRDGPNCEWRAAAIGRAASAAVDSSALRRAIAGCARIQMALKSEMG